MANESPRRLARPQGEVGFGSVLKDESWPGLSQVTGDSMCGRIGVEVTAESTAMSTSLSAAQVEQLRRNAKRLGRILSISHSEALDRIAARHGFKNWSLLTKHSKPASQHSAPPSAPPPTPASRPEPADPRRRYYLHGDEFEDDPSRYYCAQCDVLFDAAHFASHGPHTGERFLERLERWNKRDWRSKMDWRRPDDAVNLLQESALAARAQYQALRPAFSDWLRAQGRRMRAGERRDDIALMALGLVTGRGLPTRPKSLPQLQEHYQSWGKQHFELEALGAAWTEFLAERAGSQ